MKLKLDITPYIVALMAAEVAAGERAVSAAMREAEAACAVQGTPLSELMELAGAAVRHAVFDAVVVQLAAALHAAARLERARRVVHAGMNDFAVARRGAGADGVFALQHQQRAAGREFARDRQAHHAGTDDNGLDVISHGRVHHGKGSKAA